MAAAAIEHPWGRLGWIIPSALILWIGLLTIFGLLLERTAPPPPELRPTEIRMVELPPPAGLQGGAAPAAPAAPKKPAEVIPHPHPAIVRPVPPRPISSCSQAEARTGNRAVGKWHREEQKRIGATGQCSRGHQWNGIAGGTVYTGATGTGRAPERAAIVAERARCSRRHRKFPMICAIRVISTVAVAHFKVDADGQAEVTLTTPTDNPRLNEILLEALKQWRFFPATRSGVRVPSEIDVRIPVSVE